MTESPIDDTTDDRQRMCDVDHTPPDGDGVYDAFARGRDPADDGSGTDE